MEERICPELIFRISLALVAEGITDVDCTEMLGRCGLCIFSLHWLLRLHSICFSEISTDIWLEVKFDTEMLPVFEVVGACKEEKKYEKTWDKRAENILALLFRNCYPTLSNGITLHPLSCGGSGGSGGGALGMALSMKLAILSAAACCICVVTWVYKSSVKLELLWPGMLDTVLASTPLVSASVAKVWRRSWNRTLSSRCILSSKNPWWFFLRTLTI